MLKNIGLLSILDEKDLNHLELFCQNKVVKAGEVLFEEGEKAIAMYILKSGQIEVYTSSNGNKQVLGIVKAEEILGEMALFTDSAKRMASAVALVDSELITIADFSIKEMTRKYPELSTKLRDIIQIRNTQNKMKTQ